MLSVSVMPVSVSLLCHSWSACYVSVVQSVMLVSISLLCQCRTICYASVGVLCTETKEKGFDESPAVMPSAGEYSSRWSCVVWLSLNTTGEGFPLVFYMKGKIHPNQQIRVSCHVFMKIVSVCLLNWISTSKSSIISESGKIFIDLMLFHRLDASCLDLMLFVIDLMHHV